ncbi:hypothetical protein Q2T76_01940 [Lactobacillus sp. YT155]|uniref:hypothetical protein n=1 Tax=Lactobacillus sp. YT155 TaxID=3060955 RepID=UPI00265FBA90|nr:hypothetical protein [Lactobacillus sp. YT155]MDO1604810.1 hypothetical protein [Lactobacillus sp. YT155]
MFTDDIDEKKYQAQIFKIKGIKNFVVIKSQQDDYYLTSALIPWYGFYNFLLPVNKRRAMKLKNEQVNELELIDTDHTNSNQDFKIAGYWILALFMSFGIYQLYKYGYLESILIGLIIGIVINRYSLINDRKKNNILRDFSPDNILKIKSNNLFSKMKNLILIPIIPVLAELSRSPGSVTIVASVIVFLSNFYGSVGDMKTIKMIGPGVNISFLNWSRWGEKVEVEFEPPLLLSVEKLKR